MKEHPDTNVVEMDCVEGKKGESRVILTFTLRNYHLMFMFHLEYQDQECVLKVFVWLKTVHRKKPLKLLSVILTDGGSGFSARKEMEIFFLPPKLLTANVHSIYQKFYY
ncbi:hypothetical protein HMPREF1093_00166 [Hungatella hathewayi 12489931]|uniref:hypothetical protein n=1 Tax=Hungatella hathewayi TaxID=154046 RepID=UPI0002D1C30A|nr:hypothetical protein [Hungatella hathewayi]ENY98956.1 hypothetical protein HMPREF1093_00166 [Hungatella hathewayi 12489931]